MSRNTFQIILGLFLVYTPFVMIGCAAIEQKAQGPKTYKVCFFDIQSREPECSLEIKAETYRLEGGCATFLPGEESLCNVLLIAPVKSK